MILRQYNLPEFTFPVANTTELAALQSNAVAPYIVTLTTVGGLPFNFGNQARKISLTSANNLSGRVFTITGLDVNGRLQTENLAGPNANTVNSVNDFLEVQDIRADGAFTNLSVGRGSTGVLEPIYLLPYVSNMQWAINFDVTATINISVTGTLNNLDNNIGSYSEFAINASLTNITSDVYYNSTQVVSGLIIRVNSSSGGGTFRAQFMQMGDTR